MSTDYGDLDPFAGELGWLLLGLLIRVVAALVPIVGACWLGKRFTRRWRQS